MTVIYADSVLLLNGAMNYLIFLATARLAGIPLRRKRYFLSAILGGVYALACFFPFGVFLSRMPVKLAVGILLAVVAFGCEERFFRLTVLFFAVSCAMAGSVLFVGILSGGTVPQVRGIYYTDVSVRVFLVAATSAYLISTVVFRSGAAHSLRGTLLDAEIWLYGKKLQIKALYDSGNSLRDPLSGESVLILSCGALDPLLPDSIHPLLTADALKRPEQILPLLRAAAPELSPQLLPFHTVGTEGGLLLAVRTEKIRIAGNIYRKPLAAFSPTVLQANALWGGNIGREGKNERNFKAERTFDKNWNHFASRDPLHRGK